MEMSLPGRGGWGLLKLSPLRMAPSLSSTFLWGQVHPSLQRLVHTAWLACRKCPSQPLSLASGFSSNQLHSQRVFHKDLGPPWSFPSPNSCYSSGSGRLYALCYVGRKSKFTSSRFQFSEIQKTREGKRKLFLTIKLPIFDTLIWSQLSTLDGVYGYYSSADALSTLRNNAAAFRDLKFLLFSLGFKKTQELFFEHHVAAQLRKAV